MGEHEPDLEDVVERLCRTVNENPNEECPFCDTVEAPDGGRNHDPECLIDELMRATNHRAEQAKRELAESHAETGYWSQKAERHERERDEARREAERLRQMGGLPQAPMGGWRR